MKVAVILCSIIIPLIFADEDLSSCSDEYSQFESCDDTNVENWLKRSKLVKDGRAKDDFEKRIDCLVKNGCKRPRFIPRALGNGISSFRMVAVNKELTIEACAKARDPGFEITYGAEGLLYLKAEALKMDPLPQNLTEFAQQLSQVAGKQIGFDPLLELAQKVLEPEICPENTQSAVLECLGKLAPIPDPSYLYLHSVLQKKAYCEARASCVSEKISPKCRNSFANRRQLFCSCATKLLEDLAEEKWEEIRERMKSEVEEADLATPVLRALLTHFFCGGVGLDLCSPESLLRRVTSVADLWPDLSPAETSWLKWRTIRGIELDGMLPIG